jgi:hypothetical protein
MKMTQTYIANARNLPPGFGEPFAPLPESLLTALATGLATARLRHSPITQENKLDSVVARTGVEPVHPCG